MGTIPGTGTPATTTVHHALTELQAVAIELRQPGHLSAKRRRELAALLDLAFTHLSTAILQYRAKPRGRGRPARARRSGLWLNMFFDRNVAEILKERDPEDPQTITECCEHLERLLLELSPPRRLFPVERKRLRKMVVRSRPHAIAAALQGWIFNLDARAVRRLRRLGPIAARWS